MDGPKSKEAFDKACGVSNWTLHDLRRTVATGLAALEVPPHIIERLLSIRLAMALPPPRSSSGSMQHRWINHKFGSLQNQTADGLVTAVAEIYEMHAAMEVWEANLASLLKAK